jgi:uncharacterized membrane protein
MPLPFEIAKWVHIITAIVSLITGISAMISHKGGKNHRLAGKIYFWCMFAVFVTAIFMSIYRPVVFLIAVSVLSFYGAFAGYRVLRRKRLDVRPTQLDWVALGLYGGTGVVLLGQSLWQLTTTAGVEVMNIVVLLFGITITHSAWRELHELRTQPTDKNHWWYTHMVQMCSSYIGLSTALMVQLSRGLPPDWLGWAWMAWLLPTLIGTPLVRRWTQRYRQSFSARRVRATTGD